MHRCIQPRLSCSIVRMHAYRSILKAAGRYLLLDFSDNLRLVVMERRFIKGKFINFSLQLPVKKNESLIDTFFFFLLFLKKIKYS